MKLIARGKHSFVFLTSRGTILKKFKPNLSKNFEKEVHFLSKLRNFLFVPKLISFDPKKLEIEMEYVKGQSLKDIIKKGETKELLYTINKVLDICFLLDSMKIQKEEMHRPYKHVILSGRRVVLLDWERAKETKKPSNLTQFAQFLLRDKAVSKLLSLDREHLTKLMKEYKETFSRNAFEKVKKSFSLKI